MKKLSVLFAVVALFANVVSSFAATEAPATAQVTCTHKDGTDHMAASAAECEGAGGKVKEDAAAK
jgi:hypothetical protein